LIARARELGLALPVVGVLLHATGDLAFGQENAQPTPAAGETYPGGAPLAGASISAGVVGEFDTANPYLVSLTSQSAEPLSGVMDGLVAYDSQQLLHPDLAESFDVADDGVTYTFHLRHGVVFHNGDFFTARDVIHSWEMLVNPDFPAASRLGWERIASIDAPDPHTLVVKTDRVYAPFLSTIAAGAFNISAICSSRQLAGGPDAFIEAIASKPIGTGPLQVASWTKQKAILKRFDNHWAGPPLLDRITVRAYKSDEQQLAAMRRGDIQIANRIGLPGASRVKETLAIPNLNLLSFPASTWAHLDLKQIGLLREKAVRQALDFATPADEIVKNLLGGEAVRAFADQQPGSWAYQRAGKPRPYDLDQARRLLKNAGLRAGTDGALARDGETLAIELWGDRDDPAAEAILNAIAQSWGKIGVRASVHLDAAGVLFGRDGYQFTTNLTAGYFRWTNYNDPDDRFYWDSSQIPAFAGGAGGNAPAYFHAYAFQQTIDNLTEQAATETDQARRKALYWEIQNLLFDEVPVIFLFWDLRFAAASVDVGGFWPSTFTSLLWNSRNWYRA
jgi:peptide/nickel transport system substrate-binding protein